jgi:hypothetical protein
VKPLNQMPKRVPPLSAVQLAQIKPDPSKVIELTDGAVSGLRFRLTPAGNAQLVVKYPGEWCYAAL